MDDDDRAEEAALDGAHMSKIKTLSALRSLSSSSGFYMFSLRKPVEEESDLSALGNRDHSVVEDFVHQVVVRGISSVDFI